MNNKNKLIEFVIEKLNERNDLTEDQYQDLLLQCLEYINKSNSEYIKIRLYEIIRTKFKEEQELINIDNVNLAYEININEDKILADFIINKLIEVYGSYTSRYEKVLKARYFEDKTFKEIADEYNVSTERVRQINKVALNRCQKIIKKNSLVFLGSKYESIVIKNDEELDRLTKKLDLKLKNCREASEKKKKREKLQNKKNNIEKKKIIKEVFVEKEIKRTPEEEADYQKYLIEKQYIIDFYQKYFGGKVIDNRIKK